MEVSLRCRSFKFQNLYFRGGSIELGPKERVGLAQYCIENKTKQVLNSEQLCSFKIHVLKSNPRCAIVRGGTPLMNGINALIKET